MDGNIWNLKTLLSNHTSFKVDIPEVEAQSIPEMNHYFVTWNIYSIPSTKPPERSSISSQPKIGFKVFSWKLTLWNLFLNQLKLVRSSTQADLMVQYKMEQLNLSGEISGYYNESWSEAEICKTLLNPAELGFQINWDFWSKAYLDNVFSTI